jgi:hypothetical protein
VDGNQRRHDLTREAAEDLAGLLVRAVRELGG